MTGDYQFTNCNGVEVAGRGTLAKKGCILTLQHNINGRRVLATIDTCQKKATASIRLLSQNLTFTITDRRTPQTTFAAARSEGIIRGANQCSPLKFNVSVRYVDRQKSSPHLPRKWAKIRRWILDSRLTWIPIATIVTTCHAGG